MSLLPVSTKVNRSRMKENRFLDAGSRSSIENHPKLYKQFYGQPSFTWGKTLGSGQAITQGNRNPLLGKVAGADGLIGDGRSGD